jgi:hypothetical protein
MSKLGSGFVSVIICEVRPLHDKVIPRDKNGDSSTSEIATFGADEQSHTVTAADRDIRRQHVRYSAVEATSLLTLELRVRKAPAHIKAGRLSSFEEGRCIDHKVKCVLLLLQRTGAADPMKRRKFKLVRHFPPLCACFYAGIMSTFNASQAPRTTTRPPCPCAGRSRMPLSESPPAPAPGRASA